MFADPRNIRIFGEAFFETLDHYRTLSMGLLTVRWGRTGLLYGGVNPKNGFSLSLSLSLSSFPSFSLSPPHAPMNAPPDPRRRGRRSHTDV